MDVSVYEMTAHDTHPSPKVLRVSYINNGVLLLCRVVVCISSLLVPLRRSLYVHSFPCLSFLSPLIVCPNSFATFLRFPRLILPTGSSNDHSISIRDRTRRGTKFAHVLRTTHTLAIQRIFGHPHTRTCLWALVSHDEQSVCLPGFARFIL